MDSTGIGGSHKSGVNNKPLQSYYVINIDLPLAPGALFSESLSLSLSLSLDARFVGVAPGSWEGKKPRKSGGGARERERERGGILRPCERARCSVKINRNGREW